ncbi:ornithine decarboxylase antizyme-domain-containing protein [Chytriomyces sp. MP71]|nr:ornithine decarboxylase antizyme-domain-containing protein [Chytriomyces sp. MP71]
MAGTKKIFHFKLTAFFPSTISTSSVTTNNNLPSNLRSLTTDFPKPGSSSSGPTRNSTSSSSASSTAPASTGTGKDLVLATCTMRAYAPISHACAATMSAAYCFTLGARAGGVAGVRGAVAAVGGMVRGDGSVTWDGVALAGRAGEALVEGDALADVVWALAFVGDLKGALSVGGEKAVQVVCIKAKTQAGLGAAENRQVVWPGFLTDKKTLFIQVPSGVSFSSIPQEQTNSTASGSSFGFRESVVAVLELAEDVLGVNSLVVCLDKDREDVTTLIRSLLFVGFELVHPSVYGTTDKFVLVGNSL